MSDNPMYNDPSHEGDAGYFFTDEELAGLRRNKALEKEEQAENDIVLEEFKEGRRDELGDPITENEEID